MALWLKILPSFLKKINILQIYKAFTSTYLSEKLMLFSSLISADTYNFDNLTIVYNNLRVTEEFKQPGKGGS